MGAAGEGQIQGPLIREVRQRGAGVRYDTDAYWHLVAEVAVEHLHFELYDTAKVWGTDVADQD